MGKLAAGILYAICLTVFSIHSQTACASPESDGVIAPKIGKFIPMLEAGMERLQGGAIAILHKGQVIYKTTFGYQQGKARAITSKTLFPLASVSKSVAATALALMVETGKVDLTQRCTLPCLRSKVQLKHILSHTTGVAF